ncbi:MAG TPA: HD domain-containing phosphohydrolase [Methylomirabilota bacterium]|nr:HD domain-containing phosphohydrolase [Methylomirabilota bacterium]
MTIKESAAPRRARLPIWRRLGWRLTVAVLLLTAVGILASGLLQYRAQERFLRESLGGLLLNIARTGALLVDGDAHEQVVRAGRNDTPEYLALRDRLLLIQETNQLGDAVYTLSNIEGETARYGVISNGLAPVGQAYRLAPETRPVLRRVLGEGQAGFTGIYASDDGRWITAFAPIRNRTEQTVGALEVDFRADVYLAQLQAVRRRLWLHSLVAGLLAVGAGVLISRQVTRPVGQLVAAAQRVVEGDLASPVRVDARDEIGLLGNVFHLMVDRLHASHRSLVDVLVRALESRDGESGSLSRLARAAVALGDGVELDRAQREALELGALLHDIGEIRIPESVLHKPGPLTPDERLLVQGHPQAGVEILEVVPLLTPALDVVAGHHERYDGGGYPQGLEADEIPLVARVFAVADALDAMTHDRPYRAARPLEEALVVLKDEAGRHFDPRVVDAALAISPARWKELLG